VKCIKTNIGSPFTVRINFRYFSFVAQTITNQYKFNIFVECGLIFDEKSISKEHKK
jgi:hypothetical protein